MTPDNTCAQCNAKGDLGTGPDAGYVKVTYHGFLDLGSDEAFYHFQCMEDACIKPETLVTRLHHGSGLDPRDFARWTVWALGQMAQKAQPQHSSGGNQ